MSTPPAFSLSPRPLGAPQCARPCSAGTCRAALCPSSTPLPAAPASQSPPRLVQVSGGPRGSANGRRAHGGYRHPPLQRLRSQLGHGEPGAAPLPPPRGRVFWSPFLYRKSTAELIYRGSEIISEPKVGSERGARDTRGSGGRGKGGLLRQELFI